MVIFCKVSSPVGNQYFGFVCQFYPVGAIGIGNAIHPIVIQSVTIECLSAMFHDNIFPCVRHLVVAVIVSIHTGERECVSLPHVNMSEGFKGIGLFIEIGAVTSQVHAFVHEGNIAFYELCIRMWAISIIHQFVCMLQINTLVNGLLSGAYSPFACCKGSIKHNQTGKSRDKQNESTLFT